MAAVRDQLESTADELDGVDPPADVPTRTTGSSTCSVPTRTI